MTAPTDLRPLLHIAVLGTPRPKGSLRPFVAPNGRARAREQLADSPTWRRIVADTAHQAIRCDCPWCVEPGCIELKSGYPHTGPVKVLIALRFVPPKKHGPFPQTRTTGDIDKHARNILDALQDAGLIRDDAQVVDLAVSKRYAEVAGADITVWPVAQADPIIGDTQP